MPKGKERGQRERRGKEEVIKSAFFVLLNVLQHTISAT